MKRVGLLTEDLPENIEPDIEGTMDKILCPVCGKEYKTLSGLKAHLVKEHPDAVAVDAPATEE